MHQLQPVGTRVLQQHCGCVPVITFHSAHAPTKGKHCQFILLKKVSMLSGTHPCFVWAGAWWLEEFSADKASNIVPQRWVPLVGSEHVWPAPQQRGGSRPGQRASASCCWAFSCCRLRAAPGGPGRLVGSCSCWASSAKCSAWILVCV